MRILKSKNIFILLCIVIIYFFALCPPTDPDMGWHLVDGKYLVEHHFQVARADIFSYTMPDFPLIMHEWITDILMFDIYRYGSLFLLSVFFAAVTALAFIIATLGVSAKTEHKYIASIAGIIASGPILGVRAQMLSLLGLAIVVFIIFKFRQNQKTKLIYYFPLLFLIWANLHGGFPVGLFFIGVFLCLEYLKNIAALISGKFQKWGTFLKLSEKVKENSISAKDGFRLNIVLLLSALATLINPYGWIVEKE